MTQNSLKNKFNLLEKKADEKSHPSSEVLKVHPVPKIQELEAKKFNLSQEVEELISNEYDLKNNPEYIKHYIEEILIDIKKLESKKKKLKKSNSFFFSGHLNRLKKRKNKLLSEKESLEGIVSLLEKDLQKQTDNLSHFRTKNSDLIFETETLKERKSFLIREKEKAADHFLKLKQEIEANEEKVLKLRKEVSNLDKTKKLLEENTRLLSQKREASEKTIAHLNYLQKKEEHSSTNDHIEFKPTTSKTYFEATEFNINTDKLDQILNTYKNETKPKLEVSSEENLKLKDLYKKDIAAFNLIMKVKSELNLLLDTYDFEDSGKFDFNFFQEENLATLDLKNISIEKNVLNSFFGKILKDQAFKKYASPSRIYRYTANGLVKELRFKLNTSKKEILTNNSKTL